MNFFKKRSYEPGAHMLTSHDMVDVSPAWHSPSVPNCMKAMSLKFWFLPLAESSLTSHNLLRTQDVSEKYQQPHLLVPS